MAVIETGLFEAKTKLSALVREVAEKHCEIIITLRGKPMAKLCPVEDKPGPSVWEVRDSVLARYGEPELDIDFPVRRVDEQRDPLEK